MEFWWSSGGCQMHVSPDQRTLLRLDVRDERLWDGDQAIRLTPKAFALLRHLVQNPNRLLTKDEILEKVWPDTFVSEGLVREYVQDLRQALNDDPKEPRFIETVHRRGYRFLGDIEITGDDANSLPSQSGQASPPAIAVLQFENLAGDEGWGHFAAGLCDDIITDLTRYPDLQVIARYSTLVYHGRTVDVRQIARELNAAYLLEGSIQADGQQMRVAAQLVDGATGGHIWAERYNRQLDDLFAIQDDIVARVVSALGGLHGEVLRAERTRVRRNSPLNLQSYEYYLIGSDHMLTFSDGGTRKAIKFLEKSIELDPMFARAWITLAFAFMHSIIAGWTSEPAELSARYRLAVLNAAKLDPRDPFVLKELCVLRASDGDIEGACAALERALDIGGNNADALAALSKRVTTVLGHGDEAKSMVEKSVRLNPCAPDWYFTSVAWVAYFNGDFEEVLRAAKRATDFLPTRVLEILSLAHLGDASGVKDKMRTFLRRYPSFEPFGGITPLPLIHDPHIELYHEGLRRAGFAP